MLQQTRVETALPYFERWMKTYPDFASLGSASEASVLKSWEGLGYYHRARNLLRLARIISSMSHPPDSYDAWLKLPGVGRYTAAAVTSIVFHQPHACVDGNVVRILARITGCDRAFTPGDGATRFFAPLAESLLNRRHPGDHNQAMMELGAVICRRQSPKCAVCPVRGNCASRMRHDVETIPRLERRRNRDVSVERLWIRANGSILLAKRGANEKRLAQIYELPGMDILDGIALASRPIAVGRRRIGNDQITETIHEVALTPRIMRKLAAKDNCRWASPDGLENLTISGPHRRWIKELLHPRG